MKFKPLFDLRSTTIIKAFLLNAIVLSIIASLSIELRNKIDIREETKGLTESNKLLLTMIGTFFMGIIVYVIIRLLFGFGDGLMAKELSETLL